MRLKIVKDDVITGGNHVGKTLHHIPEAEQTSHQDGGVWNRFRK